MEETLMLAGGRPIRVISLDTAIVGTGAAGYNAANRLFQYGKKDIAIIAECVSAGTSRNTGSDKQTYYKLSLCGSEADSVRNMARTLFDGQCVDGDVALCEAALSCQEFMKLVELGMPFPQNEFGEYVGYKTDHDPARRATSVGPYTSRMMTEVLERSARQNGIRVFDRMQVIRVLAKGGEAYGLLCLDLAAERESDRFVAFNCANVVYATGGPAGMYADSVYPASQTGASGIAFEAGVAGKNLTEWQYGLASTRPRWNVSGSYMQVLPRFFSTDGDLRDKKEFLSAFFSGRPELLTKIFLKGYQWPFDVRKIDDGSSIIDILVYVETLKGRRVFLDFTGNPGGGEIDFSSLGQEAREYLDKAGACFGTPIERLRVINEPAIEFYGQRGVDLSREPLEIALCAQHNNGGLDIDAWWQTNVSGFFAVGEACASHGVYRPGGSALNAGQVGSTRAARFIAYSRTVPVRPPYEFMRCMADDILDTMALSEKIGSGDADNVRSHWTEASKRMSRVGAAIRDRKGIVLAARCVHDEIEAFGDTVRASSPQSLSRAFRLRDMLISQYVYLCAMADYIANGGKSRGSALYTDASGARPLPGLPETIIFSLDDGSRADLVQEATYRKGSCSFVWRKVRPIPEDDSFFENVWRAYRKKYGG